MVKDSRIDSLVASGHSDAAILELRKALRESPGNVAVRKRLADILESSGRRQEAAGLLVGLAEQFAADGFTAKAIATVKKVQRVDRRRPEMAARLAELILRRNVETGITPDGKSEQARTKALDTFPSLRHSPLASELSAEELVVLIHALELESYGAEEDVFAEGENGDCLYVVTAGSARVLRRDAGSDDREVGTLQYGDFFGERCLLGATTRTTTVRARQNLEVLKLDRQAVDALAASHPRIAEVLHRFLEQRAGSAEEWAGTEADPEAEAPTEAP